MTRRRRTAKRLSLSKRIWLRVRSRTEIDGLSIIAVFGRGLDKVVAAVKLIRDTDGLQYRRVLRDLDRIIIDLLPTGASAQYEASLDACELDERTILSESVSVGRIAAIIVHEATHARLEHLGFSYIKERRQRIEDVCVRRERAFASRLPDRETLESIEEAKPDNLTDAAFAERRERATHDIPTYLGVPHWVQLILRAIGACITAVRWVLYKLRP
ncbi:hypothetical protein BH10PSE9_BH10PSE9_18990 [soil metagenome]